MQNETKSILKKILKNKYAGYVLIACGEPCKKGKMQVQMVYEGDETLISYLLENGTEVYEGGLQEFQEA